MTDNQRPGQPSWILNHYEKIQHFFRTNRREFLASLVTTYEAALENTVKMSQPIEGSGGHLRFLISEK